MIDRRAFLIRLSALAGLATLSGSLQATSANAGEGFASAFTDQYGNHFIGILDPEGKLLHQYAMPSRGHSACISRDRRLTAFFARRPRRWLTVLDLQKAGQVAQVESAEGRHFYGHGVFSHDGAVLYTTENDYPNRRGVIGLYDVKDGFRRIGEIDSHGTGPHEIGLLSDGKTLVVANGGIETHPDYGRLKLNLDSMAPSLTYIDPATNKLLDAFAPPHHQLSLRHMAIAPDDTVVIGAQYQGPQRDDYPLVFHHRGEAKLQPLTGQPVASQRGLNHYIASVAVADNGRIAVTSAPRGDRVSVWDITEGRWLRDIDLFDIGGVSAARDGKHLVLSSGNGDLYTLEPKSGEVQKLSRYKTLHWDNHLVGVA